MYIWLERDYLDKQGKTHWLFSYENTLEIVRNNCIYNEYEQGTHTFYRKHNISLNYNSGIKITTYATIISRGGNSTDWCCTLCLYILTFPPVDICDVAHTMHEGHEVVSLSMVTIHWEDRKFSDGTRVRYNAIKLSPPIDHEWMNCIYSIYVSRIIAPLL